MPRTWVKNEYAYLAPNAARLLLSRCNLKHNLIEEASLSDQRLAGLRALLIPNAAHLAPTTIARIESWLAGGDRRLIVTGKTNLPPKLLGLKSCTPAAVEGFTGWRWLPGSPFANDHWEKLYVSSYRGFTIQKVEPAAGSRILVNLRADGRSGERIDSHRCRARPRHRRHRQDRIRRQPGLRDDRRHDAGPSQRRAGAAFHQCGALGRHAAVLPAAVDAGSRLERTVEHAAALLRRL